MKTIKKILIAEDELLFVKVMRMEFEKRGYQIESVLDAQKAYEKTLEFIPDLILLDVRLKNNSSGIEAAKKIRAEGIETPIIFTTGNSFENTHNQTLDIENTNILIKPIDFNELFDIISKLKVN
jgi:two-component system response regulator VicR